MFLFIKNFLKKYKTETILFFCALAAQLIIFYLTIRFGTGGFFWSADTESYFTLAKNLLIHHGFYIRPEWGPSAFRTPLYPLFIAALYWLLPRVGFIILVQNILGAFSVVLVYRFAKYIFGKNVALLSSVLFLIESQRLQATNQLMSETLFMIFFIPALYFFFLYKSGRDRRYALLSGLFLGVSTLIKPITQYLPFVMLVFIFFEKPFWESIKRNIAGAAIFTVMFLAAVLPWSIRNKIHFDTWKLSPLQGVNLYYTSAVHFLEYQAKARGEHKEFYKELTDKALRDLNLNLDRSNWTEQSIRLMEFEYEPYFMMETFKIISSDLPFYLRVHLGRMIPFLIDSSLSRSGSAITFHVPNRPNWIFYPYLYWGGRMIWAGFYLTMAVAAALNWQAIRKRLWVWIFFGTIILYFGALAAMNWDAPRMRLPVNPLIFMMFSEAFFLILRRFKGSFYNIIPSRQKNLQE